MANVKISDLSSASTPLSGAELVPVVQSGVTKQTTVNAFALTPLAASAGSSLVGYLPAGTGAETTTVQAKLRETVSVMDFGAVGDGDHDDTDAIQKAIDYAQNNMVINTSTSPAMGPQTVFFPSGYYKVSSPILISKAISLLGEKSSEFSTGARIFQTTDNHLFSFIPAGGGCSFSVERLTFISTVTGNGNLINTAQGTGGVTYNSWRVLDCCFSNPQQFSIKAIGDDIQIINSTFDVSGWNGKSIQLGTNTSGDGCSNVRIIGCNFFNIPVNCIYIYNAKSVVISNNIVSQPDSSTTTISFVDAMDTVPTLCTGIDVIGNVVYNVRRIVAFNTATNCSISGNTIYNAGIGASEVYNAIELNTSNDSISITGNTINGNYGAKSILFANSTNTNVTFCSNVITGTGTGTALICGSMTGKVVGNTINGFTTKISADDYYALGYINVAVATTTLTTPSGVNTYTIDASTGTYSIIIPASTSAFTVAAPINPSNGQMLTIQVYNNVGTLGTITWNSIFKLSTFTNPANNYSRCISFIYSSGLVKWTEISRTTTDIPN